MLQGVNVAKKDVNVGVSLAVPLVEGSSPVSNLRLMKY